MHADKMQSLIIQVAAWCESNAEKLLECCVVPGPRPAVVFVPHVGEIDLDLEDSLGGLCAQFGDVAVLKASSEMVDRLLAGVEFRRIFPTAVVELDLPPECREIFEEAIRQTGISDRSAAIAEVCRFFMQNRKSV